jgi:hypothetical protein
MEIEFKTRNEKQISAAEAWLDDLIEEILYGGAKGGGKSFLGASLIFGDALIYPETHYFIARKEGIDLRKFTIPTIGEVFKKGWKINPDDYMKFNGQDSYYQLHNGSRVYLIACKDIPSDPLFERFGSMQMTRGWIEEGGEVPESAKNNLWLSIGRWNNVEYNLKKKLLITANPKKGWMKRDFVDPWKQGSLPSSRIFIPAFATDNTYLSPDYLETLRSQKDKVSRQRLWEGDWEYDDDKDSLITFDSLTDCFSNTITKDGERYMTVDVARKGVDTTAVTIWDGLEIESIDQFEKQATNVTEQKIKDLAAAKRIPYSHIIIDEDGIGGGVVDHLMGVKGFVANSTPIPTAEKIREKQEKLQHQCVPNLNFKNLKAQCGWKLAELINEHKIAFKVPEWRDTIIEELTAILRDREVDGDGKKQLVKKDKAKQDLNGRSPDIGDTILMRAWFELVKNATGGTNEELVKAQAEQSINLGRNRRQKNLNNTQ